MLLVIYYLYIIFRRHDENGAAVDAIEPNWMSLIVFAAVWAVACIGAFYLIGIMPLAAAPGNLRRGLGPVMVLANVALVALLAVASLAFAIAQLRWTSLVVAGGMVFLFSPFVVQDLPPWLKDNRLGLALVMVLALGGLALLFLAGLIPIVRDFRS